MRILLGACLIWIIFNSCEVKGDCNDALGMRNRNKGIPDSSISSSSSLSAKHAPGLARLDEPQGAWCSAPNDNSPYVQIQLGEEKLITKMMTQGSLHDLRWATKYRLEYLKEGKWIRYQKADGSLTLDGNTNVQSLEEHVLQPPVKTHLIRIYPMVPDSVTPDKTLDKVSCLRLELYGCSAPVNGGWGEWGVWSGCSVTCGVGMRSRERKCDSPKPKYGGAPCNEMEKTEREECRAEKCQVIDGGWGKWGPWSECSLTCGLGMRSRERKCDSPKPKYGGKSCSEAERVETRFCRKRKCGESKDDYEGYSGSGHDWDTYSGDGSEHGGSGGSKRNGWHVWSESVHWRDSDDEDFTSL